MARGYLGMRPGDLDGKPYAHHWRPDMAPLADPARRAVAHGPEAAELGLEVGDANRLLDAGDLPIETGYTRLPSGQLFVAVRTPMPGVTAAMIDWWMGWHGGEPERYKLWHPRAHVHARTERALADVPGLSDRERWVGDASHVVEYIGEKRLDLRIAFREPSEYLDTSRFEAAGVGTAVCARTGAPDRPVDVGHLIHVIRETPDGSEMRSRFWLGDVSFRGAGSAGPMNLLLVGPRLLARRIVTMELARDLLVHCAMEMAHLASFLPALWSDMHRD